mmetsp:Transcript_5020/g.14810  ORF Transcript_5020/g.14810 Transcript_5020/m.14810 type:complete len:224 (+) Transcript_5020:1041-1712(+)
MAMPVSKLPAAKWSAARGESRAQWSAALSPDVGAAKKPAPAPGPVSGTPISGRSRPSISHPPPSSPASPDAAPSPAVAPAPKGSPAPPRPPRLPPPPSKSRSRSSPPQPASPPAISAASSRPSPILMAAAAPPPAAAAFAFSQKSLLTLSCGQLASRLIGTGGARSRGWAHGGAGSCFATSGPNANSMSAARSPRPCALASTCARPTCPASASTAARSRADPR